VVAEAGNLLAEQTCFFPMDNLFDDSPLYLAGNMGKYLTFSFPLPQFFFCNLAPVGFAVTIVAKTRA